MVVVREAEDAPAPDLTVSLTDFDLGLSALVTDSNGITVAPACSARKGAKKLRHEQRKPSRAMSGSKHRAKQRQKVARVYERIAAQRAHQRHKVTSRLVNDPAHKGFVFEDFSSERWLARLREPVSLSFWWDPRNTTQECSGCGLVVPKGLEERLHRCVGEGGCGLVLSRDENAARNIKRRGEALLTAPFMVAAPGCGTRSGRRSLPHPGYRRPSVLGPSPQSAPPCHGRRSS